MSRNPISAFQTAPGPTHAGATRRWPLAPAARDLIRVGSRRWFLQTGLAGVAGLSLADMLARRAAAAPASDPAECRKSVVVFWLSGGPSQLDMWDPKPDAPREIRSPFATIPTRLPGVRFSEHLPLQASIAHKLSIIRSVDCSASNHTPITMQAGNPLARRTDDGRDGAGYPSMGAVAAKFRGPNQAGLPAFIGLADSWVADVYGAGEMGTEFEPVKGQELAGRFNLPEGVAIDRLRSRHELREQFDRARRSLDQSGALQRVDRYTQQAYDMVLSGAVQKAFQVDEESEATREAYGRESIGQKALLARRLVEAGVTYVLVSGAWGYFDHHGDSVRWGGIEKGLKPLLPRVDQVLFALVNDLEQRGLLENTLILMLGEFGRGPVINQDAGRDHWTNVMSMVVAGGGLPHGQVIGSTDARGGEILSGIVRPQDVAATVFRHLQIPLDGHWVNPRGRPTPIVVENGQPIPALLG
jgi:hypothetical protein